MKKVMLCCLLTAVLLVLAACSGRAPREETLPETEPIQQESAVQPIRKREELRAVWITYQELSMAQSGGGDAAAFRAKAAQMMENAASIRTTAVFVHVRAFCDAFYKSTLFPYSKYITGEPGKDPGYDPLQILIEEAHKRSLELHAWINPYRVSYDTDFAKLAPGNPARKWKEEAKQGDTRLIVTDSGIYFNPANSEAQKLILDGVREIVHGYAVDGIHYDDYFYPSTADSIDQADYDAYRSAGGTQDRAAWRRENVNSFVSGLYSLVKAVKPDVTVSISPAADIDRNVDKLFADVALWCRVAGYCDIMIPQVYYGFENEKLPFAQVVEKWAGLPRADSVQLAYGLAFYKCGDADTYASTSEAADSPRFEWQRHTNIIVRQLQTVRTAQRYGGYALYSYTSMFAAQNDTAKREFANFQAFLQNN